MAEGGQKRSKTAHRTPGQIKRHGKTYQAKPDQIKKRGKRNAARAKLMKEGKVKKGDNKEVNHRKPISKGGSNARSNLEVQSRSKNRAHGMSKNTGAKNGMSKKYKKPVAKKEAR
ncbi:MAG: hypothetical protein DRI24_24520, partial [Deltaproteobacteria bacterium]